MKLPYSELIAALVFALLFVAFSVPAVVRLAGRFNWFDPPGKNKLHTQQVSKLGGFAIFGGVMFSVLLFVDSSLFQEFKFSLGGFILLFLAGFLDDINPMTPWQKFLVQLMAAIIIAVPGKVHLLSFYGFLGVNEIPYEMAVLASIFLLLAITNAYSIIDGVDLLATLIGVVVMFILAVWLTVTKQFNAAMIAMAFSGSLAAFAWFNRPPALIFMGDSGTMPTGMAIAVLLLKAISVAGVYTGKFAVSNPPVWAFGLLALPLFDMIRVFTLRIISGHSPFYGDRSHLHHRMLSNGWSHRQTSFLISGTGVLIFGFVFLINLIPLEINTAMLFVMTLAGIGVWALLRFRPANTQKKTPVPEHRS